MTGNGDETSALWSRGRRYDTPTGLPCPRSLRLDGTIEGSGDCHGCGHCLGRQAQVWPGSAGVTQSAWSDPLGTLPSVR